jgi:hypothetical protein
MKKQAIGHSSGDESRNHSGDVLASVEKVASSILQQVKRIRKSEQGASDARAARAAVHELREHLRTLHNLATDLENREKLYAEQADRQFLEFESAVREACGKRAWRVDGQWPTLYIERAVAVEVSEAKQSVLVAGKKIPSVTVEAVVAALEPLLLELLPQGFSPTAFMRDLAAIYDSTRHGCVQLPVFDLYRGLVVNSQPARFWRDARAEGFRGLSADQFRARLTATLEAGVTSAPDGREIRFLPPLDAKDGLFMYQPAESRYGFVGRIEFVANGRSESR